MIATTSPVLQLLNEKVNVLSLSPVERKLYESRMKLKSDIATISEAQYSAGVEQGKSLGLAEGKSLGLAEGKSLGLAEGKLEMAKTMLSMGYSLSDICKISGLSQAEVEAIS